MVKPNFMQRNLVGIMHSVNLIEITVLFQLNLAENASVTHLPTKGGGGGFKSGGMANKCKRPHIIVSINTSLNRCSKHSKHSPNYHYGPCWVAENLERSL